MSIFGTVTAAPVTPADSGPAGAGLRPHLSGLLSLSAASCLAVTTELLPVGLLPAIGKNLQASESLTGLLISLYAAMVASLAVPLTLVTARFGRKPLLLLTLSGYAVCNAMAAAAPVFAVMAAGRAIGGISHALFFSLCIGYAPRLVPAAYVGRALAIAGGGASAGVVLGVPLATSLGTAFDWRVPFTVLAGVAIVILILVARSLPSVSGEPPAGTGPGGRSSLVAVVGANTLTWLGQFTIFTYISLVLLSSGLDPALLGPALLACGACGVIGLFCTAKTLDRNPRRTATTVLLIVIGGLALLALTYPNPILVLLAAGLWNGAFGGMASIYQACAVRCQAVSPELAGAWVNAGANIGIAGGAAIGAGLLNIAGIGGLAPIAIALLAAGLAVVVFARSAFPSRP